MKKNDSVYLRHILDAISRIEEYTRGIKQKDFINNHLVQDGVIRQMEIIGEANVCTPITFIHGSAFQSPEHCV